MTALLGVIAFLVIWLTLLGGPIMAAMIVVRMRHQSVRSKKQAATFGVGLIIVVAAANLLHIEIMWKAVNFGIFILSYLTYCGLAALAWTIRPLAIRIPVGLAAYIPLLPGYVLGTIGIVALPFILGDELSPALKIENVRPGLFCRTTGWGAAFSDEGYTVHLYRYLPLLPIVRVEVKRVTVDESAGGKDVTCQSVASSER